MSRENLLLSQNVIPFPERPWPQKLLRTERSMAGWVLRDHAEGIFGHEKPVGDP